VLNSVADERVARQLLEGGLTLGGEERPVTMLFCDIRGFTAHTENMAPAEVIEFLNEHMTALTRVVKNHHGVLDKFVGDLLMALFGAPVSRGQDALDGARCALEILSVRNGLNAVSRHRLQVGIGVATGQVVAGCMGSLDRLNYTVIGERVNLASRLCSLAKPGQVVVDEATRLALGDLADVRPLAPVKLKGFSGEVQAFELVGLREAIQSDPDSR
jgi:class 3 adenylate cyclase